MTKSYTLFNDAGISAEFVTIDSNLLTVDHYVDMEDIIKTTLDGDDEISESDEREPEPIGEQMLVV